MKVKFRDRWGRWVPVFLWMGVIFTISSVSQVKVAQVFFWDYMFKKTAHMSEYFILYVLLFRATKGNWLWSYVLTLIYSISDEFHQSFVPGRTAALYDLAFDASGANLGAYLLWKSKAFQRKILNI